MANITLNKKYFFNNLDIIAKQSKGADKIALVLKDNAYGHGIIEIAKMASEYGITKAVVNNNNEAKKIENYFEYILVLADIPNIYNNKIRYTINDLKSITKFPELTRVELKVDTGMHRNGIAMCELKDAMELIKKQNLILEAVFTHHRSADELSSEWFWQNENFKNIKSKSKELGLEFGFENLRFHSANSASLFRYQDFSEDMARVGIAVYGCLESIEKDYGLKPILSLYADRISSREMKKGEFIGYGATYKIKKNCVVSNYNFGYGDGFLRICSNNFSTVKDKELVGRISMDNSSYISDDEQLHIFNDARVVSKYAKTISYEVLTSLKSDLKREII